MVRYISLILFIGLVWGQDKQDKLVLNNKTEYLGEFIKIEGENIVFKETDGFAFQSIPIKTIKKLELADSSKSIIDGVYLTSRILEIQEIARADAKQNNTILDWLLIGICSGVTGTCGGISMMFLIDDTVPIFIAGGILGAALPGTIFYFNKYNNSKHIHYQYPDLINTEEEKNAMEQNSQFLSDSLSSLKLETNVSEKNMNETYHNAYNNELKRKRKIDLLKFGILSSVSIYAILIYLSDYFDMPL
jgi:hypothetical protein